MQYLTLVRSYLHYRDALLRPRIKSLFEFLRNIITIGEIPEEVHSSNVDKFHISLTIASIILWISRQWVCHINLYIFSLTLRTTHEINPHVKKQLIANVNLYLKDGNLHHKYARAFVLNIGGGSKRDILEARIYLVEPF